MAEKLALRKRNVTWRRNGAAKKTRQRRESEGGNKLAKKTMTISEMAWRKIGVAASKASQSLRMA